MPLFRHIDLYIRTDLPIYVSILPHDIEHSRSRNPIVRKHWVLNDVELEQTLAKDHDDWAPLSLAAKEGHEPIVRLLIDKSNVNTNDNTARTPLSLAAEERTLYHCDDIAQPDSRDYCSTPLSTAVSND